jgi:sugar phosphate isomerase/epimerase
MTRNPVSPLRPASLPYPPLSLAALGFLEVDPPTLVSIAAEAGFSSVSMRMRPAMAGGLHYPLEVGSLLAQQTRERIRDTGVGILQIELITLDRTTDIGGCRSLLEAGAALGAERLTATGDDPDPAVVAGKLGELAALALEYRMTVDLEFMPFRRLATLEGALAAIAAAGRDNVVVMVDALHLVRSGGRAADVAATDPQRLGVFQLCDGPLTGPAPDGLAAEAREARLLPGRGGFPLGALLDAMPARAILAAEVPLAASFPGLSPRERARMIHAATVGFLAEHRRVVEGLPAGR